jgi:hypothetical protein
MEPSTILEAMRVHTADPGYDRVFVLGSFERRVTVYSQQVRALNLVHALFATNVLHDGARLAVIGGGVAGLTAAAGAKKRGVRVTVLEREADLLPLFRRPAPRWLHPGVYDWPLPGWSRRMANLPVMTWQAGLLATVVPQLRAAWQEEGEGVNVVTGATDTLLHPDAREPRLTWNAPRPSGGFRSDDGAFDAVIVAVGFGREPGSERDRGYWQPDDLDDTAWFDPARDERRSWLVSGCGDGGLTEVFRLCLKNFRHERIVEEFLSDPRIRPFIERIREIEADPRSMDPVAGARFLTTAYKELEAPFLVDKLAGLRREDTDVWLNGTGPDLFEPGASPANRFLLAQLRHAGAFRYLPGRIEGVSKAGGRVEVRIAGQTPRLLDRYVRRHGPIPALQEGFPDLWERSLHLRETWKRAPHLLDRTRTRTWAPGAFGPEDTTAVVDPEAPAHGFVAYVCASGADVGAHRVAAAAVVAEAGGVVRTPADRASLAEGVRLAGEADVVIAVVGHLTPRVPAPESGGDGEHTVTAYELEAARDATFAFVLGPNATGPKESDGFNDELVPEAEAKLRARVRQLRGLRTSLVDPTTITTEAELREHLGAKLQAWKTARAHPGAPPRTWTPRVEHPLQPARFFQGRTKLLAELDAWWAESTPADRVVGLVAIGGTGKTAVAERVLAAVRARPRAGGVLVWSFYERPDTSAFLEVAERYFCGVAGGVGEAGGRLERLKGALRGGEPHLLVLDGLERVQAEGTGGSRRGVLDDPALRHLLVALAVGLGNTRALVTSRFPLTDLEVVQGTGYRPVELDHLDEAAARAVLAAWGVHGDDASRDALAASVGRHALSVAVLGSYLGTFCGGDPAHAGSLDLTALAKEERQADKLTRVLGSLAAALTDPERQLMARLSLFTRGIAVGMLGSITTAGGSVSGILLGAGEARLVDMLERLRRLGLVFGYVDGTDLTWTAHPFVRDHFRGLLDVPAEQVHEVVRQRLAPGLEARPSALPMDTETLDRYERLIEETRLAGREAEAFDLYWYGLGHAEHLAWSVGEYARGERILAGFAHARHPEAVTSRLPERDRSILMTDWGTFADRLGDLWFGERCHREGAQTFLLAGEDDGADLENLASAMGKQGHLPSAEAAHDGSIERRARDDWYEGSRHAQRGGCVLLRGRLEDARTAFAHGHRLAGRQLQGLQAIGESELLFRTGNIAASRAHLQANRTWSAACGFNETLARLDLLEAHTWLPADPAAARAFLASARAWSTRTGDMEVTLGAHVVASAIALAEGDAPTAIAEATEGLPVADHWGWGLHAIDLRVARARARLAAGQPREALQDARAAYDAAVDPECDYAWGVADAAHLAGIAHARLGESALARRRLDEALAKREAIEHPGAGETRAALAALG